MSAAFVSVPRAIIAGSIGHLVEWCDWHVYSAFALCFAPVFLPKASATAQLLNTAAISSRWALLMRRLEGAVARTSLACGE